LKLTGAKGTVYIKNNPYQYGNIHNIHLIFMKTILKNRLINYAVLDDDEIGSYFVMLAASVFVIILMFIAIF